MRASLVLLATVSSMATATMIKKPKHLSILKGSGKDDDKCSLIKINSNFDDLKFTPILPFLNPVGQYEGLIYTNFAGANTNTFGADLNFLDPESKPNVIVTGFEQTFFNGGGNPASLTTKYEGAARPYFNLHDLTIACFANDVVSVANIPVSCDVTFRSYRDVSPCCRGEIKERN